MRGGGGGGGGGGGANFRVGRAVLAIIAATAGFNVKTLKFFYFFFSNNL